MTKPMALSGIARQCMLAVTALFLVRAGALAAAPCESLRSLKISNTKINTVESVAAGKFVPPPPAPAQARMDDRFLIRKDWSDVPAFCRVNATVKTSATSSFEFEVWLPVNTWNGNFMVHAYRYYGGLIEPEILVDALMKGYATATTDNGSGRSQSARFMLGQPEKLKDWADRAWHETTVKSKLIIQAFYGAAPKISYFDACGGASRYAMKEMQAFPEDYDMYAIGGHSEHSSHLVFGQLWDWQLSQDPAGNLMTQRGLLHRSAVAACDAKDGLKDGVIGDPEHCDFDPAALLCKGADGQDCLGAAQVETARAMYRPLLNPRTKAEIQGPHYPGSEMGWNFPAAEPPRPFAIDFVRYLLLQDPDWDYKTRKINFDADVVRADSSAGARGNAIDPRIQPFLARGGKVLLHEGWNDARFVKTALNYYKDVQATLGKTAGDSVRLFMIPNTGHCVDDRSEFTSVVRPGETSRSFDTLGALVQWKLTDKAPDEMTLRETTGSMKRDVLVCAYPKIAMYRGSGDPNQPASYQCQVP